MPFCRKKIDAKWRHHAHKSRWPANARSANIPTLIIYIEFVL